MYDPLQEQRSLQVCDVLGCDEIALYGGAALEDIGRVLCEQHTDLYCFGCNEVASDEGECGCGF